MDWNLKSPLDWGWDNNINMSSCSGFEICKHAEPFIHEKEVHKGDRRQIFSLNAADSFSGYSLAHDSILVKNSATTSSLNSSVKDVISFSMKDYYGKEKRTEKYYPTSRTSAESLIGLNLNPAKNESVTHYPVLPLSSTTTTKRCRGSYHLMQNSCCQVEGCNVDLTSAKEYHRRHGICEAHSKTPMVIVAGMQCLFCQQCSRFHDLCEFDDKKRSCRRRLSEHNARRRRQPEAITSIQQDDLLHFMIHN